MSEKIGAVPVWITTHTVENQIRTKQDEFPFFSVSLEEGETYSEKHYLLTTKQLLALKQEYFEAGHLKGTGYIPELGEIEKDFNDYDRSKQPGKGGEEGE